MTPDDERHLQRAVDLAGAAREHGNHPFGALLVDGAGSILAEAENTVVTGGDVTGHAELNLVQEASGRFEPGFLQSCTLYASTEPCGMCAGAIFWAGIGRVVFALSSETLRTIADPEDRGLLLSCREVFARGGHEVEVLGPHLEDEAVTVHHGFWG
jgi:tRNA(Arg) A34 adenosine deaminase TadA